MQLVDEFKTLATVDIFAEARQPETFVGRPFYFDFSRVKVLCNDAWKQKVGGIPAGAFLLAVYDDEAENPEIVLLRVLGPTPLPSDPDVVATMVEHYKEHVPVSSASSRLDSYTRYEFQFSGLECRVLGSFYREAGKTLFGADVDNFYSPNNYSVYKPGGKLLEYIVNFREGVGIPGGVGDERIGKVRYASSRHHPMTPDVPINVSTVDYLSKRTALFGMTRTGKSNTVKNMVEATYRLPSSGATIDTQPILPIGQIIFDVNGEYANDNQQDEGTAIYQLFKTDVTRYSIMPKKGFEVLKTNFYAEIQAGFELIYSALRDDGAIYTKAFLNVNWEQPDPLDKSAVTRYDRRKVAYQCILYAAGFPAPPGPRAFFAGNKDLNAFSGLDPSAGLTLDQATTWLTSVWERMDSDPYFARYKAKNGRDWADEDLKTLLRFLTRCPSPGASPSEAGYRKLISLRDLHTPDSASSFYVDIMKLLRAGKIVIIDLSQGNPEIQRTYSERLCQYIFNEAMDNFVNNRPVNAIQLYFEEAHNLFPRKDDADLRQIYNRIAKEGAKLGLGLVYATQEVSSISANVLKNTQNWFISHLNNQDELREIARYYDFEDFVESLRRATDKGFIRMKTYSNPFIVPVQIDRFTAVASPAGGSAATTASANPTSGGSTTTNGAAVNGASTKDA